MAKKTFKLYRIWEDDGRRMAAGAFRASTQDDLAVHWQLFLATVRARPLPRQLPRGDARDGPGHGGRRACPTTHKISPKEQEP